MIWILRAIFGAMVCGDFLLAVIIVLLLERRTASENAEVRKALTGFPPDGDKDAAKRAKEAREESEAWRLMQHYDAGSAYGGDSG